MQEQVLLTVSAWREVPENLREAVAALLKPLQPVRVKEYPFGYDYYYNYFPETLGPIQAQLTEMGLNSSVWVSYKYTKWELSIAEFLIFGPGRIVGSKPGTLHWERRKLCQFCGFEEVVWNFSDLKLKRNPKGFEAASVDHHPPVVSEALAKEFISSGFSGLQLFPVGQENPPTWFGLRSDHFLPPVQVPPTRQRRTYQAMAQCLPSHALAMPHSQMFYTQEGFEGLDFNYTYEYYGDSGSGTRLLVISNRVYRLLLELGVSRFGVQPLQFIGRSTSQ